MQKPVDDHLTGSVLEGRYTVGPRLARGGTAGVYRAVDERLDRTVAVKIMHAHLTEDPSFVDRFAREARAAARLSHPSVVAVLDQGRTDDGLVFLVMEYVEGGTLRDVLRRKRFLRPGEALTILAAVASGLAAAHQAGLIHRDVKPENVLMRPDGTVKVADFGLSRAAGQHTTSGAVLGTVAYASPELVTERSLDARSDLYSLGVMAWEMLTGRRPFDGSPWTIAHAHAEKTVPSLLEAAPGIDPALAQAVTGWTAKDPDLRPADGAAMAASIGQLRRELSMDALDHVPQGWDQGPGPAAPRPEDPGATTLPSFAPATGPIDLGELRSAQRPPAPGGEGQRTGSTAAAPADDTAAHAERTTAPTDDTTAAIAGSPDQDIPPITQVLSIPLSGAQPDAEATEAMPRWRGAGSSPAPAAASALDDERTEALPGVRGETDDPGRTAVLPPLNGAPAPSAAAAAGAAGAAGAGGAGLAAAASSRSGSTAAGAAGTDSAARAGAGAPAGLGASVDPNAHRQGPSVDRLAAFDETPTSVGRDDDTAEQEADVRGAGLRESAPVDPSTPTVRLQQPRPLRAVLALALAALLVALAAFLGWLLGSGSFRTAVVPDVAGTSQELAVSAVETEGFSNVAVHERSSAEVPDGTVIESSPAAGAQARVGEQVVLTVSTGPEQVEIPSVEGLDQTDAESQLEAAGLSVGSVTEQFDEASEGSVVSVSPAPGSRVAEGSAVDLIVSVGPQPEDVPRVVGSDADDARERLEDLGFTVEIEEVAGGSLNRVVSQNQDGTTITLRVI